MTETEFLTLSVALIDRIEDSFEATGIDLDLERKGEGLLEVEFGNQSRIIINSQAPMRQIWVAAKSGGFHFAQTAGAWLDTRTGEPLMALLSRLASEQTGARVALD